MKQAWREVLLSVVAEVVTGYIDLLVLDEQRKITQSTSDTYAEALLIAQLQFEYGVTSLMTVAQATFQYETAQRKIADTPQYHGGGKRAQYPDETQSGARHTRADARQAQGACHTGEFAIEPFAVQS